MSEHVASDCPIKILNIDDSEVTRRVITRAMELEGYSVTEAVNGTDGLEMTRALRPDLVVLDVKLPDIDGFEVCRTIKSDPDLCHIPVLHISAICRSDEYKMKGLMGGADGYLTHPVAPHVLTAMASVLLRMSQAERSAQSGHLQRDAVIDALDHGICLVDRLGGIVRHNRIFADLLGAGRTSLWGNIRTVLHPEASDSLLPLINSVMATGQVAEAGVVLDGRALTIRVTTAGTHSPSPLHEVVAFVVSVSKA